MLLLLAATAIPACAGREADARPQLVVVLDTDMPTFGQVTRDDALSREAAIDTVRVDIVDDTGRAVTFRELAAPDVSDWPLSFGVVPAGAAGGVVRLHIRVFAARDASPSELDGVPTLEPAIHTSIARLVEIALPTSGVRTVRVLLAGDCFGVPASFVEPRRTCVDDARRSVPATTGVIDDEDRASTRVGTWALAREVPCPGDAAPDRVCIPGGLSFLGASSLVGVEDGAALLPASPPIPVHVAPFFMDRTEFTVGRARALLPKVKGEKPVDPAAPPSSDPIWQECSFRSDGTRESHPLNCVDPRTAEELCQLAGGSLPTEAQWNHAATGRGQRRGYPWGNDHGGCCNASVGRTSGLLVVNTCAGAGTEPVGSHPASAACNGLGDVSRDGVLDMGGSVTERTLDVPHDLEDPCLGVEGVRRDPVCRGPADGTSLRVGRGGNWTGSLSTALNGLRLSGTRLGVGEGFRCVYSARP